MADEVKRFPHVPGFHVNTMKIIGYLEPRSTVGTIVTDKELSELTGEVVDSSNGHLASAMRYL